MAQTARPRREGCCPALPRRRGARTDLLAARPLAARPLAARLFATRLFVVRLLAAALLAAALLAPAAAAEGPPLPRPAAAPPPDPAAERDLFAMPRIAEEIRAALGRAAAGDVAGGAEIVERLLGLYPEIGLLHASRAAFAMLGGDRDSALAGLEAAAERSAPALAAILEDPLFAPLAADPSRGPGIARLKAALPAPPPPPRPAEIRGGVAEVTGASTAWNPATERLEPRFAFAASPAAGGVLPAASRTAARDLLREHWRRGRAAGNHGDLYDNRDRGHSALEPGAFPQLAHVAYAPAARAAGIDYGLNDRLLFPGIAFGNSSTAITAGPHWRSLPRHALTRPDGTGPMRLWQNWAANHLYVHPAHRDYGGEAGDLFPANTPYLLVSRGSSGSDRPVLEAIAMILAAFRPETKARLVEEKLVVPTVQMVFRRSLQPVRSRESYFSGDAHPAAFEGYDINLARMVSLANAIAPGDIPAEARLEVIEEELGAEGVDFFGDGLSERLFDTPSAVARIWRSRTGRRSMVLSAEASRDANGRPLSYHWHLLQGDPERVRIEPVGDGARARVTLDWHEPFRISEENDQISSRVDIGLFVHNGVHDSAPAILSWAFPVHESRVYEEGPDGAPRIAVLDHADPERAETYADPLLFPRADWRDVYRYDAAGAALGWTRHRGGMATDYRADGARVLDPESGRAEPAAYRLVPAADGGLAVEEVSGGR